MVFVGAVPAVVGDVSTLEFAVSAGSMRSRNGVGHVVAAIRR